MEMEEKSKRKMALNMNNLYMWLCSMEDINS